MSQHFFGTFCSFLHVFCCDPTIAYEYLYCLAKTDRFDMNLAFLEDTELEQIHNFMKIMNKPCVAEQLSEGQSALDELMALYDVD